MIIEAFVISMLVGLIRRGRLSNIGQIPLRHYYAFVLPILIIGVTSTLAVKHQTQDFAVYVQAANVLQYVGLLVAVALNMHMPEIRLAGVGIFLNGLVVTVNSGMMPCSMSAAKIAGVAELFERSLARHCLMTSHTKLAFLGDVIPIPPLSFIPAKYSAIAGQVCSIGDLVVALSIFLLIQRYMCLAPQKDEGSLVAAS